MYFNKNTGMINAFNDGFRHVDWYMKRGRKLPWSQRCSGLKIEGLGQWWGEVSEGRRRHEK